MRPHEKGNRRLGQPAVPDTTTDTDQAKVPTRIADRGDGADPRAVGDLLGTWLGIRMAEVDELVDQAHTKVDALPDQRTLWLLFGEALVRLHAVELEVAGLRAEVARLRQRGRAA